jgi:hypothetical protein
MLGLHPRPSIGRYPLLPPNANFIFSPRAIAERRQPTQGNSLMPFEKTKHIINNPRLCESTHNEETILFISGFSAIAAELKF